MNNRVLIIDDDPNFLEFCHFILSPPPFTDWGNNAVPHLATEIQFDVVTVSNAEQALAQVQTSVASHLPFAAIFLDLHLEGKSNSHEVLKKLSECDPKSFFVLVNRSAEKSFETVQKLFGNEGAHRWDFLSSPFNEQEFLQKARHVVSLWNRQEQTNKSVASREQAINREKIISLNEPLEKALQILKPAFESRHITVLLEIPEIVPRLVLEEEETITLFVDLLKNAIRESDSKQRCQIKVVMKLQPKHVVVKFEDVKGRVCSAIFPQKRGT